MTWPVGLPLGSINFGAAVVAQSGENLPMRVTIEMVLASDAPTKTLVYRPTGQPLVNVSTTFNTDDGTDIHVLSLPLCDTPNMGYGNGTTITLDETHRVTHTYRATIDYLSPDKATTYTSMRAVKNFVLTSQMPTGDIDDMVLIPTSFNSFGVPIAIPAQWEQLAAQAAASAAAAAASAAAAAASAAEAGSGGGGGGVDPDPDPEPSASLLFGWSGPTIPGVGEPEFLATWMTRNNWQNLSQGNYLGNNDDFTPWIQANPTKACNIGVPLIPHDSGGDLNALLDSALAGQHDQDYRDMGGSLAYWGNKTVYARLFWEMNIRNGSSAPGDVLDRNKFKAVWNRAVPLMREGFAAQTYYPTPAGRPAGQTLLIDFSPLSDGADYKAFYPGDANVDIISMDVYACIYGYGTPDATTLLNSVNGYLNDVATFAAAHGKRTALGEFGNWQMKPNDGGEDSRGRGDFPEYIDAVFNWAIANDAAYLSYYNIADNTGITLANTPNSLARIQQRLAALRA